MTEGGYAADRGFGRGGTRIWISLPVRGSSTTIMTRSRQLNSGYPRISLQLEAVNCLMMDCG